jgi:pyridinium-3,5-biscarboxylic acid mononucleotide sulfurtransferase
MHPDLEAKYAALRESVATAGSAIVALSGGVDSSLLTRVCHDVLGDKALAATIVSPMLARRDLEDAQAIASAIGIELILIETDEIEQAVRQNLKDRCYHCKREEFGAILRVAGERDIPFVMDGRNADDRNDYRPGTKAARELGIISPLQAAGFTKDDVRELARALGVEVWEKPANACLASRVPYGETITPAKLEKIEQAEAYLYALGFRGVRVRCHEPVARIEVHPADRERFCDTNTMDAVSRKLKEYGFLYVSLDLDGYATGSLNRALQAS